jgi:hypothetical protein
MSVLHDMASVAAECIKKPRVISIWSKEFNKYICEEDPRFQQVVTERLLGKSLSGPTLNPAFKLVFLTAAGGTLLFVVICVITTYLAGAEMHPPLEKLITGLMDLAKIGFGAVGGLLGAPALTKQVRGE